MSDKKIPREKMGTRITFRLDAEVEAALAALEMREAAGTRRPRSAIIRRLILEAARRLSD